MTIILNTVAHKMFPSSSANDQIKKTKQKHNGKNNQYINQ